MNESGGGRNPFRRSYGTKNAEVAEECRFAPIILPN